MTHQAHLQPADASTSWLIGQAVGKAKHLGASLAAIFRACADAWEAASLYEDLSRLSDAELERRGIPRADLHRCVFGALAGSAFRDGSKPWATHVEAGPQHR